MSTLFGPPIFCDNCSSLAVAELDGAPLCIRCLLETLKRGEYSIISDHIAPLENKPFGLKRALPDSFFGARVA